MAELEATMFREYDLRGRVNENELNEESVPIIAKAYGTMLQQRGIKDAVVGYDLRTGSKEYTVLAVKALRSTGVNVIFLGQVLTPIMYAAQYHYKTKGGMMVTASHNPDGWLGFKLALGYSYTFGPKDIQELQSLTRNEKFSIGNGDYREVDYLPIYTEDVVGRVKINKPVKVLVNAGNGTAGPIVPDILRKAGCEVFEFLTEPDLKFKKYFPNPSLVEMMQDTGDQTVQHGADIGFAFDGDGDRLGTTDEKGNVIWPDRYMILLSRQVLEKNPGAHIVYDMKSTRALGEDIKANDGKPYLWKTGHSYIKQKLHELGAPLGGEGSGHIFFGPPEYYGFDDAVFTALKLAEILSRRKPKTYSQLMDETPFYYSTPTWQAEVTKKKDEDKKDKDKKYNLVAEIVQNLQDEGENVIVFEDLRFGGRVEYDDGWGLIRASSNLEVLVLRFEATTQERLDEIEQSFRDRLGEYPEISKDWKSG